MGNPILPKDFAAYIHPLQAKRNYTRGSDGKTGLSDKEAAKVREAIACSPVLSKDEKQAAQARLDQALDQCKAGAAGGIDAQEMQSLLDLAKHDLSLQPLTQGAAVPMVSLDGKQKLRPEQLKSSFLQVAAGTCYAPKHKGVEGGTKDCMGASLKPHTLEAYVDQIKKGKTPEGRYVAIAMDAALFKPEGAPMSYGDVFRIPEIEKIYQAAPIYFAVVDTGGAFSGAKNGKVDICCASEHNYKINQSLSLYRMLKPDGSPVNIEDLP